MPKTLNLAEILLWLLLGMLVADRGAIVPAFAQDEPVLTYHGDVARTGAFVVPALTRERARALHLDTSFRRASPAVSPSPSIGEIPGRAQGC